MSEIVALETVLEILRADKTANTVEWAILYGLYRYPEASTRIADAIICLLEKGTEHEEAIVRATLYFDDWTNIPESGARLRRLLPKLKGAMFNNLLIALVEKEQEQTRQTVLQFLDQAPNDKNQNACLVLCMLPDGAKLLIERLAPDKPLRFDLVSIMITLLKSKDFSVDSVACALDILAKLPHEGHLFLDGFIQLLDIFTINSNDLMRNTDNPPNLSEYTQVNCTPIIKLNDALKATALLNERQGQSAAELLFALIPKDWLTTPPEAAREEDELNNYANDSYIARCILQALNRDSHLRNQWAEMHAQELCWLIVMAVGRIQDDSLSSQNCPENATLAEAIAALQQPRNYICNEQRWISRTASFGAQAVPELRQLLTAEWSACSGRAAEALAQCGTLEAAEALASQTPQAIDASNFLCEFPRSTLATLDARLLREALEKQDYARVADILNRWDKPYPEAEPLVEILLPYIERLLLEDENEAVCVFIINHICLDFHRCLEKLWRSGEHILGMSAEISFAIYDPTNPLLAQIQRELDNYASEKAKKEISNLQVISLRLRCRKCAAVYTYQVRDIFIFQSYFKCKNPSNLREHSAINDIITCKRCAAIDEYDWTPMAVMHLSITMLLQTTKLKSLNQQEQVDFLRHSAIKIVTGHTVVGDDLSMCEAISRIKQRITQEPNKPEWMHRLACVYYHHHENALALATYSELLARWPEYTESWLMRAQVYERLGRHAEALSDYTRVAKMIRPDSDQVMKFVNHLWRALHTEAHAAGVPAPLDALQVLERILIHKRSELPLDLLNKEAHSKLLRQLNISANEDDNEHWDDNEKMQRTPVAPLRAKIIKARPNDRCPCGSGKKYKKCCGRIG